MYKVLKIKWISALFLLPLAAGAQGIDEVLQSVGQHNKVLQALQSNAEAAKLEARTSNSLGDFSVQYSPFFMPDVHGVSSSELVVSQGFDFPTLYGARHKSNRLRGEAADWQYAASRRDVLLQAKLLCLDLVRLNREQALLAERSRNADELLAFFEQRLAAGDASAIEVNKVQMERMAVRAEVAQNNAAHRAAVQSLLALNGNMPLELGFDEYPPAEPPRDYDALLDRVLPADAALLAADALSRAAAQEVSVNRQQWLPKLEIGYRRNTSLDEASHGFLAGVSLPLFSNRREVKIAQAQSAASSLQLEDARLQAEARLQSQYNAVQQLREAMQAYDLALMRRTLDLLRQAVLGGQMSSTDYYVEADAVYRNMQAFMVLECQYHKVLAELYKNEL